MSSFLLLAFVPLVFLYLFWVKTVLVTERMREGEVRELEGEFSFVSAVIRSLRREDWRSWALQDYGFRRTEFEVKVRVLWLQVRTLASEGRLPWIVMPLVALFAVVSGAVWLKSRIYCGYSDIFLLSGLAVAICRGAK